MSGRAEEQGAAQIPTLYFHLISQDCRAYLVATNVVVSCACGTACSSTECVSDAHNIPARTGNACPVSPALRLCSSIGISKGTSLGMLEMLRQYQQPSLNTIIAPFSRQTTHLALSTSAVERLQTMAHLLLWRVDMLLEASLIPMVTLSLGESCLRSMDPKHHLTSFRHFLFHWRAKREVLRLSNRTSCSPSRFFL